MEVHFSGSIQTNEVWDCMNTCYNAEQNVTTINKEENHEGWFIDTFMFLLYPCKNHKHSDPSDTRHCENYKPRPVHEHVELFD